MNPKIALFLSTTLTAFVVATLSGVVNKVTSTSPTNTPTQAMVQQVATDTLDQSTDLPATSTAQTPLGPDQAAALAAQAIDRKDVYSVETSTYKGVDAYKVVFSSGDIVFIGFDSQVLAKNKPQPVVVNAQATNPPKHHRNNGGNSQSSSNNNSQPSSNSQPGDGGGEGGGEGGD